VPDGWQEDYTSSRGISAKWPPRWTVIANFAQDMHFSVLFFSPACKCIMQRGDGHVRYDRAARCRLIETMVALKPQFSATRMYHALRLSISITNAETLYAE